MKKYIILDTKENRKQYGNLVGTICNNIGEVKNEVTNTTFLKMETEYGMFVFLEDEVKEIEEERSNSILKELLEKKFLNKEEFELIEGNEEVLNIENNGNSSLYLNKNWFIVYLSDSTEYVVYL